MQLRPRLELTPETISDFAYSAEQKYWEGIELAASGHRGAAIYLMGYAAEMLLKAASFRVEGAGPADLVEPRLVPARNWLSIRFPTIRHEAYHSLVFWLVYLRARRAEQNRDLDRQLDGQLVHRVRRLYQVWWVEMRYRPDQATDHDVHRALSDMTWIRDSFVHLWR